MTRIPTDEPARRSAGRLGLVAALAAAVVTTGCDLPLLKKKKGPPSQVSFRIVPRPDANASRSFYAVVRSVTEQEFITDDYAKVAGMVFATPASPEVLRAVAVVPGRALKLRVPNDGRNPLAVYGLYTEPGDQWKVLLPQPVRRSYKLTMDRDGIRQE